MADFFGWRRVLDGVEEAHFGREFGELGLLVVSRNPDGSWTWNLFEISGTAETEEQAKMFVVRRAREALEYALKNLSDL